MFLLSQLTVEILIISGLQKIGTEHLAVCDASNCNKNCTKVVNNEHLNSRRILDRGSENYFCYWLLLSTRYFVCVQFNNPASI